MLSEDIQFMMREFLFPTMATFFDDTHHKEAMSKTHFAAYFSQFPDSDEIARQKKSKLLCGLCEKGRLYRSMEGLNAMQNAKHVASDFLFPLCTVEWRRFRWSPLCFQKTISSKRIVHALCRNTQHE